jgi:hypothetical protein
MDRLDHDLEELLHLVGYRPQKNRILREGGGVFDSDRAFERLLEAPGYIDNLAPVGGRWIARHVTLRKAVSGSDRHCPSTACLLD